MPGMLDTILNLGLNDRSVEGLAARTGNERFARDSHRRLVQMFGNVVRGIPGERFEDAIAEAKSEAGVELDTELDAGALRALNDRFQRDLPRGDRRGFPRGSAGAALRRDPRRVRLLERAGGRSSTGG